MSEQRTTRLAVSSEELEKLKEEKERLGLENLPHGAFIDWLIDRHRDAVDSRYL